MKDFIKMTLAAMCAIVILSVVGIFFFASALSSIGSSTPALPRNGILTIDMSKIELVEQEKTSASSVGSVVQQGGILPVTLWDAVKAIGSAAEDPSVKFIYLLPDGGSAGIAQIEELRQALLKFRSSGKPVVSYFETPTTGSYWLASVSDRIYMNGNSGAGPAILGVGTQMIFLKDLLDKLGINIQLIRHGKYKSAGEMYVRNSPSPENLEQYQAMVSSLWNTIAEDITQSRGISIEKLDDLIDNMALVLPQDMVDNGLVDELVTKNDLEGKLMILSEVEDPKDLHLVPLQGYIAAKSLSSPRADQKIAVIFADGNIVESGNSSQIAGDRYAATIAKVRRDSSIKAVVLRVNSPGGTVLAADKIRTEIDLLSQAKPVVASYGEYAASGGYWISCGCDKIFTNKTTLTGSIGVFGAIPDFSKTAKDLLHVNVVSVGSSKHSDFMSGMRPLDKEELTYMQTSIENIYGDFVAKVAQGRELKADYVDSIAQGRVWTGAEALKINLVDDFGTLEDAILYAAALAGEPDLNSWKIDDYPKQPSKLEVILKMIGQPEQSNALAGTPFEKLGEAIGDWDLGNSEHVLARMPYEFVIE